MNMTTKDAKRDPSHAKEYCLEDAAVTMALAVLSDRIRSLPKEDKNDLWDLSQAFIAAETCEERDSAARGMHEILSQAPVAVRSLHTSDDAPRPGLRKWIEFVADRVRMYRKQAKLTQAELARRSGLTQSHVCRIEKKEISPNFVTVEKLAKGLGIDVSKLDPSA